MDQQTEKPTTAQPGTSGVEYQLFAFTHDELTGLRALMELAGEQAYENIRKRFNRAGDIARLILEQEGK